MALDHVRYLRDSGLLPSDGKVLLCFCHLHVVVDISSLLAGQRRRLLSSWENAQDVFKEAIQRIVIVENCIL